MKLTESEFFRKYSQLIVDAENNDNANSLNEGFANADSPELQRARNVVNTYLRDHNIQALKYRDKNRNGVIISWLDPLHGERIGDHVEEINQQLAQADTLLQIKYSGNSQTQSRYSLFMYDELSPGGEFA